MINVELHPGEKVRIRLHEADGEFIINFGLDRLTVISYLRHRSRQVHEEIFVAGDTNEFDDDDNWVEGTIGDGMRAYDRRKS